jgi:hypothetical protein
MDPQQPKLKLSEVLGALVASLASARSVADIEALRMADRYRQNELLRGLPIPRLRFSRVAITVPIIISGVVPGVSAEAAAPSIVAAAAAKALREALAALAMEDPSVMASGATAQRSEIDEVEEAEVRAADHARRQVLKAMSGNQALSTAFEADLQRELTDELLDLQHQSGGVPLSDAVILERVRETHHKLIRRLIRRGLLREQMLEASPGRPFDLEAGRQRAEEVLSSKLIATLLQRVSEATQRAAVVRSTEPPDLEVLVDTDAIKNMGGGPSTVTQLHLTLIEEGLEWVGDDQRDENRTWKLMPE